MSFDLFGTLVTATMPPDPAVAVAAELRDRDVSVPDDWATAYATPQIDVPATAEIPLPAHVAAALRSRDIDVSDSVIRRAVIAAFDPDVRRRPGVDTALQAARERGPVGLCSNCSVPELVSRTLVRADLRDAFDAIVTSAACGFRKPHPRPFETLATDLGSDATDLIHVGDDSEADGGVTSVGGTFIDVTDTPLADLNAELPAGGDGPCR